MVSGNWRWNGETQVWQEKQTDRMGGSGRGPSCQLDLIENRCSDAWACTEKGHEKVDTICKKLGSNPVNLTPSIQFSSSVSVCGLQYFHSVIFVYFVAPRIRVLNYALTTIGSTWGGKTPEDPLAKLEKSLQSELLWSAQKVLKSSRSGAM